MSTIFYILAILVALTLIAFCICNIVDFENKDRDTSENFIFYGSIVVIAISAFFIVWLVIKISDNPSAKTSESIELEQIRQVENELGIRLNYPSILRAREADRARSNGVSPSGPSTGPSFDAAGVGPLVVPSTVVPPPSS